MCVCYGNVSYAILRIQYGIKTFKAFAVQQLCNDCFMKCYIKYKANTLTMKNLINVTDFETKFKKQNFASKIHITLLHFIDGIFIRQDSGFIKL